MQFRIEDSSTKNGAATLIATTSAKSYTITGLKPRTNYWFHVYSWNGIREGAGSWLAVNTHGIRIRVPTTLTVGTTYNVTYLEYPLGSVPIGTEPNGLFGGGNRQTLSGEVDSVANGVSTLEVLSSFDNFPDNKLMQTLDDGSFGAFDGVKAIYFKN